MLPPVRCLCRCCLWNVGARAWLTSGRVLTSLLVATATVRRCSMTFTLPSPVSASVVWDPPPPWHACHFFCCRLCVVVAGSVVCCDAAPSQMPLPLLFVECGSESLVDLGESLDFTSGCDCNGPTLFHDLYASESCFCLSCLGSSSALACLPLLLLSSVCCGGRLGGVL